jgi:hypothetical protein
MRKQLAGIVFSLIGTGVLIAIVHVSLFVIGPFNPERRQNDQELAAIEKAFVSLPHPVGSELLSRMSRTGLLFGNGNHCDFFIGEIRRYSGSADQLHKHYQSLSLANPTDGSPVFLDVQSVTETTLDWRRVPDELLNLEDWGIVHSNLTGLYIVTGHAQGGASGDWRCH